MHALTYSKNITGNITLQRTFSLENISVWRKFPRQRAGSLKLSRPILLHAFQWCVWGRSVGNVPIYAHKSFWKPNTENGNKRSRFPPLSLHTYVDAGGRGKSTVDPLVYSGQAMFTFLVWDNRPSSKYLVTSTGNCSTFFIQGSWWYQSSFGPFGFAYLLYYVSLWR